MQVISPLPRPMMEVTRKGSVRNWEGGKNNDTTINSFQNRDKDHGKGDDSREAGELGMSPLPMQ